jgi:hypothetical protein
MRPSIVGAGVGTGVGTGVWTRIETGAGMAASDLRAAISLVMALAKAEAP